MINSFRNSLTSPLVGKRLRTRLWLFGAIALALCALIIRDVVRGDATWWSAIIAFAIGGAVGIPLGMLRTVEWHETGEEIVSKMDIMGGVAIAAYIVFDISREWLLGHWFSGADLTTIAFSVLAGALLGRFVGMHASIQRALSSPKPGELL